MTPHVREPSAQPGAFGQPLEKRTRSIRHEKIPTEPEQEVGEKPAVRRYRPSRSWPVGGLALAAAVGAVLTTGALSSALDGGPDPAFAARIGHGVANLKSGMEAHAAIPGVMAPASPAFAPSPAGPWQIQVGAFRNPAAAEAQLRALESEVPDLTRLSAVHQLRGGVNRVRIGGIADEAAARRLCARLLAAGRGCFVVAPEV